MSQVSWTELPPKPAELVLCRANLPEEPTVEQWLDFLRHQLRHIDRQVEFLNRYVKCAGDLQGGEIVQVSPEFKQAPVEELGLNCAAMSGTIIDNLNDLGQKLNRLFQ